MSARSPVLELFHPAVAAWFARAFPGPTEAQVAGLAGDPAGRHTLVAAPTGSGKTLTAFLAAIDALVREGLSPDGLPDETQVVYVSPLKALSNDIHLNLEAPLAGIRAELARMGLPDVEIRTAVRTGDTPQSRARAHAQAPPHILVTTPESLYVLLGSESGRAMLATARTRDRRRNPRRRREQARQPPGAVAGAAGGAVRPPRSRASACRRRRSRSTRSRASWSARATSQRRHGRLRHRRHRLRARARPGARSAADAAGGGDVERAVGAGLRRASPNWSQQHRTTLVFVNTRRMAERAARHLGERLGKEHVAAHHGSLAQELRLDAEQRLKRGELKVLVATASLELGIDIGDVDLVCQLGSPRSIAAFLQRVGRSGHHVGGVPKGRLFPQSRDDLVECAALARLRAPRRTRRAAHAAGAARRAGAADRRRSLRAANGTRTRCSRWCAAPGRTRELPRKAFDDVVRMLAEGFTTRRGHARGYLHRDAVHRRLRGARGRRA